MSRMLITLCILISANLLLAGQEKCLHARVSEKTMPSVFQAWNPIDMPDYPLHTLDQRLKTAAKHDLLWEEPISQLGYGVELVLGVTWQHKHQGLATHFTKKTQRQALKNRATMLSYNPHMVFLMEIRWRDAPGSYLPEDSDWWLKHEDGTRVAGWDGGPEPYYMLNYENAAFQDHVAVQAKVAIESGVYDGIMLDWSGYLPIVKKVRQTMGEHGLIIVNIHDDIEDGLKYQDDINGSFMELNIVDRLNPSQGNQRSWRRVREALLFFEKNLQEPRINCLEVWGKRRDLRRMRAATTLSLTHSNGYVLFGDPNPLKTPDHLHDWYPYWDVDLGKATSGLIEREDGAYQREFEKGTVLYNPEKNHEIHIEFKEPRTRVSDGHRGKHFSLPDIDGGIFLYE